MLTLIQHVILRCWCLELIPFALLLCSKDHFALHLLPVSTSLASLADFFTDGCRFSENMDANDLFMP